jgi:hypothetical protein
MTEFKVLGFWAESCTVYALMGVETLLAQSMCFAKFFSRQFLVKIFSYCRQLEQSILTKSVSRPSRATRLKAGPVDIVPDILYCGEKRHFASGHMTK